VFWHRDVQVPEFDASELAFRFMAQVFDVTPYPAAPQNVVRQYSTAAGGALVQIANGTAGVGPVPGDIISFDNRTTGLTGHVAVVVASSFGANGNGTVTLLSQNDTTDGWRTLPVVGWQVRGFGQFKDPYAWLHGTLPTTQGRSGTGRVTIEAPTDTAPRQNPASITPPASTERPPPLHGS
jgi:hypothetical protein